MPDNQGYYNDRATLENTLQRIRVKFEADFEPLNVDGQNLEVLSIANMPSHLDALISAHKINDPLRDLPLWAKVWPASFVLGRFLRKFEPAGKTLLELGAGMGVCSLVASRHGFERIVVSDISKDALDFAHANILRNNLGHFMEVCHIDVTAAGRIPHPENGFDLVAASEILYLDDLHRPLLKFLDKYLAKNGKALFCIDMARAKPRFKKLASRVFSVREGNIGVKSIDDSGETQRRVYTILILEK